MVSLAVSALPNVRLVDSSLRANILCAFPHRQVFALKLEPATLNADRPEMRNFAGSNHPNPNH